MSPGGERRRAFPWCSGWLSGAPQPGSSPWPKILAVLGGGSSRSFRDHGANESESCQDGSRRSRGRSIKSSVPGNAGRFGQKLFFLARTRMYFWPLDGYNARERFDVPSSGISSHLPWTDQIIGNAWNQSVNCCRDIYRQTLRRDFGRYTPLGRRILSVRFYLPASLQTQLRLASRMTRGGRRGPPQPRRRGCCTVRQLCFSARDSA